MYTLSCKEWALPPDNILPLQLLTDNGSSCNWYTLLVANTKCFRLILQPNSGSSCNRYTLRVANWVLPPNTILPLQLQPHRGSSCNQCTLWVANTECFRMILYYPFSCNPTEVWVAIDVHSELQILSAYTWYYTTSLVAIGQWFELQSMCTLSCKYWVLTPDTILLL
jgi:hypothetical protein